MDPATDNLSDGRLKIDREEVTGAQSLAILSKIPAVTYTRTDTGERRLGHIADEVEEALADLGISNVTGETNYAPGDLPYGVYKTLDYARLVPLLLSGLNSLAARVQELESAPKKKRNGPAASKPM